MKILLRSKLTKKLAVLSILFAGLLFVSLLDLRIDAQTQCTDNDNDGVTNCEGDCRDNDPEITDCAALFIVYPDYSYPEDQCTIDYCQENHYNCPSGQTTSTPNNNCVQVSSYNWSVSNCGNYPTTCPGPGF